MPVLLALVTTATMVGGGLLLFWRRRQRFPVRQHPMRIVLILLTAPILYAFSYPLFSGDFTLFSSDYALSAPLPVFLLLLDFVLWVALGLQLALETNRLKRQRQEETTRQDRSRGTL